MNLRLQNVLCQRKLDGYKQAVDPHSNICIELNCTSYLIISSRVIQGNSQESRMAQLDPDRQLMTAAKNGSVKTLEQLVKNDANVNYTDIFVSIYHL